jgi:ligand-binding sensor domain-containing protein
MWFDVGGLFNSTPERGVSQLGPDGVWRTYTTADGLASDDVGVIAAGPDGSIWFGSGNFTDPTAGYGMSRLKPDGTWTIYTTADGLAGNSVLAMAAGPDGSMWFGTDGGVSRYKPAE